MFLQNWVVFTHPNYLGWVEECDDIWIPSNFQLWGQNSPGNPWYLTHKQHCNWIRCAPHKLIKSDYNLESSFLGSTKKIEDTVRSSLLSSVVLRLWMLRDRPADVHLMCWRLAKVPIRQTNSWQPPEIADRSSSYMEDKSPESERANPISGPNLFIFSREQQGRTQNVWGL